MKAKFKAKAKTTQAPVKKTRRVYFEMPIDMYPKVVELSKKLYFSTPNAFIRSICRDRLIEAGMLDPADRE